MTRDIVAVGLLLAVGLTEKATAADPGRVRVGMQVAFASEQGDLFGSGTSSRTRLFMVQPQIAVALVRTGERPVVEFINEATIAHSVRPLRRYIFSLNEGFRFHVLPTRKIGGYLELGAGIGSSALHTDPNDPNSRQSPVFRQLDGWLQYHLQVGAGLRINAGKGSAHLGYRLTHFSNNGTKLPNLGLNLHTVVVGYQTRPF